MKTLHFDAGYKQIPWEIVDGNFHWLLARDHQEFVKFKGPCICISGKIILIYE